MLDRRREPEEGFMLVHGGQTSLEVVTLGASIGKGAARVESGDGRRGEATVGFGMPGSLEVQVHWPINARSR